MLAEWPLSDLIVAVRNVALLCTLTHCMLDSAEENKGNLTTIAALLRL